MTQFVEKHLTYIVGLVTFFLLYKYTDISYYENQEFIKQFTTIGTCTFGFLLTLFSLIIQGDNQAINKMRKRHKPFIRFISANKKIVIFSFLLTIYAYIIGYIDITTTINKLNEYPIDISKLLTSLFYGGFLCFIIETMYFLCIFYLLIQGKKGDNNDSMR